MASVAEIVTEKILEQMQNGKIPWVKPWASANAINYVTRKPYRGINIMLLDLEGEYLTWNQVKDCGGTVKKGAKARMVVFYKSFTPKQDAENDADESDAKTIPLLRYYQVFHLSDCDGIESKITPTEIKANRIPEKESFVAAYLDNQQIKYKQSHSDKAFYTETSDSINLPLVEQFDSTEEYYSTLYHEMTHSTGIKSRLNRPEFEKYHSGKTERSKEELCAEIGAASLMTETGMDFAKTIKNTSAYIQSWVSVLKNDKNFIISAASKAQKAVDFIIEKAAGHNQTSETKAA